MKTFLNNVAGIAGSEFALLFGLGATALLLSGHDMNFGMLQFAAGNF